MKTSSPNALKREYVCSIQKEARRSMLKRKGEKQKKVRSEMDRGRAKMTLQISQIPWYYLGHS